MQRLKDLMIYQDGGKIWDNLNSTQRRDYIYNAFLKRGYKPTQAAAIVGNLQQENDSFGTSRKNSIGALGIAQWLGSRKKALLNSYDKWHDIDNQIDFIDREIQGDKNAWTSKVGGKNAFFNTDSIDEATKIFRKDFERPGEHEANDKRRIKNAYAVLGKKFDPSLYQESNQTNIEIPLPQTTSTSNFSGMTLADMDKFDFNTLPPSLQEGIILEQEKVSQDRVASQVEQENLAIQQALEMQKQEKANMLSMLPKAQYVETGIDRTNNYSDLLKNTPNTFQKGGKVEEIKNYFNEYISSPKYLERLQKSGDYTPQSTIRNRLNNLNSIKSINFSSNNESEYNDNLKSVVLNTNEIKSNNYNTEDILAHEISHGAGALEKNLINGGYSLSNRDVSNIKNRVSPSPNFKDWGTMFKYQHDTKPSEIKADMDTMRYLMSRDNVYDAGTQNFDQKTLNNIKIKYKDNEIFKRLSDSVKSDEDLIWLMNNIAANNKNNNNSYI